MLNLYLLNMNSPDITWMPCSIRLLSAAGS